MRSFLVYVTRKKKIQTSDVATRHTSCTIKLMCPLRRSVKEREHFLVVGAYKGNGVRKQATSKLRRSKQKVMWPSLTHADGSLAVDYGRSWKWGTFEFVGTVPLEMGSLEDKLLARVGMVKISCWRLVANGCSWWTVDLSLKQFAGIEEK